jgi:hypothetical protein
MRFLRQGLRAPTGVAAQLVASHVIAKIGESLFEIAAGSICRGKILLSRQQQPHRRDDDRERITRARRAAEALFTAKPAVRGPSVADAAPADQSARKPRVLGIVPAMPVRHEEVKAPVSPEPQPTGAIPRSQFARIRALVKYGMTVAQVAEVYGIAVGAVERILGNA